jgi:hypothetical protein
VLGALEAERALLDVVLVGCELFASAAEAAVDPVPTERRCRICGSAPSSRENRSAERAASPSSGGASKSSRLPQK